MLKNLIYGFLGIFIGRVIICTSLILMKNHDYLRFWGYAGYAYLPLYDFIFFLMPFLTYVVIVQISHHRIFIKNKLDFLMIGLYFSIIYSIANIFIKVPLINNFVYYGIRWVIIPLILFWTVFMFCPIWKKND